MLQDMKEANLIDKITRSKVCLYHSVFMLRLQTLVSTRRERPTPTEVRLTVQHTYTYHLYLYRTTCLYFSLIQYSILMLILTLIQYNILILITILIHTYIFGLKPSQLMTQLMTKCVNSTRPLVSRYVHHPRGSSRCGRPALSDWPQSGTTFPSEQTVNYTYIPIPVYAT